MKIGFIGLGYVGGTAYTVIKEFFETVPYDKYMQEYKNNLEELSGCEIIFLAVPTPMKENGEMDSSNLKSALKDLSEVNKNPETIIVIRSTAIPGTTEELSKEFNFKFAFNPEFLREKNALEDFKKMNRVVIGADSKDVFEKIKDVYSKFLPSAKYVFTNKKTAEMIKYAANSSLACQITMANELYKICENLDINYEDVKNILLLDERIARNINVPGPDGNLGFGGKCFPKDISALIQVSKKNGYNPKFFESMWAQNLEFRKNHDWENIKGATSENNFN